MAFTIYVRMKKLGKQRKEALAPTAFVLEKQPDTVRELLTALVTLGVRDYNARKEAGEILPYLTKEEIAEQSTRGKVAFGVHYGADASEEDAAANAIQCFEDGIYRVFAGETELTALEEEILWTEETVFTFVRLTMLAGW